MFKKFLSKILFLCFLILVIFFSISNPENVLIGIWPLNNRIEIPLFFFAIFSVTLGIFIGMLVSIFSAINKR
tara:strand:- start:285 stop:500 length:216 start_codon:yes stop_codon:yes gene_type:complete